MTSRRHYIILGNFGLGDSHWYVLRRTYLQTVCRRLCAIRRKSVIQWELFVAAEMAVYIAFRLLTGGEPYWLATELLVKVSLFWQQNYFPKFANTLGLYTVAWQLPYITVYYRILPNITLYYRILSYITEYYRILPNITLYYRILPYITVYYRILSNTTAYYRSYSILPYITKYYRLLPNITVNYLCYCILPYITEYYRKLGMLPFITI
jgi:hypothetical protein